MKFVPLQYREQMSVFFGKRGWSWHIGAVITKAVLEGKYEVECFVHIFDNCTQNSCAVLPIIEHLLNKGKEEYPEVLMHTSDPTMPDANIMQPRSQGSLLPALRSERDSKNSGWLPWTCLLLTVNVVIPEYWRLESNDLGEGQVSVRFVSTERRQVSSAMELCA